MRLGTALWHAAPRVWRALNTPGPDRDSWPAVLGSLASAVVIGLVYWWLRTHH